MPEDQTDITLYDKYQYDYSTYWTSRQYEHEAETMALERIFRTLSGSWIVDIGGSFGRHADLYHKRYHHAVLLDYSINALSKAQQQLRQRGVKNIYFVAANAYFLPLRSNMLDAAMMVRVIHHLEKPDEALKEVERILVPRGTFVLEFPNKNHIKAIIKSILTFGFVALFLKERTSVPSQNPEGTHTTEPGIMYNFSYRYIRRQIVSHAMKIYSVCSVSFLRIPFLKRIISTQVLISIERLLQHVFGWTRLTPSIIVAASCVHAAEFQSKSELPPTTISDLLVCPVCKQALRSRQTSLFCQACALTFPINKSIFDLRYPQVTG